MPIVRQLGEVQTAHKIAIGTQGINLTTVVREAVWTVGNGRDGSERGESSLWSVIDGFSDCVQDVSQPSFHIRDPVFVTSCQSFRSHCIEVFEHLRVNHWVSPSDAPLE
jgi:hypothetical protein